VLTLYYLPTQEYIGWSSPDPIRSEIRLSRKIERGTGGGRIPMQMNDKTPWHSHDLKVKMLDWSATRGSRLAYSPVQVRNGYVRVSAPLLQSKGFLQYGTNAVPW
jgi:hypothetical protein